MTMNSRVTKALLGTYSRRGPLFSVVYLQHMQPRLCSARAMTSAHFCLHQATVTHSTLQAPMLSKHLHVCMQHHCRALRLADRAARAH